MLKKFMNSRSTSIDEFLQRIASQPNGNTWSVIITANLDHHEIVEELEETLAIFTECEVGIIPANNPVNIIVNHIQSASENYLVIWNFNQWNDSDWREFDQMRSRLVKKLGVVLVLLPEAANKMFRYAPNIVSWIGSRVYEVAKNLEFITEEERQTRLSVLREWSGFSDGKLIELAESDNLPHDPEYGEWLVLLGREDLIGR